MSVIVSSVGPNERAKSNSLRKEDDRKRKRTCREQNDKQMFSQGTADVILDYCIDYWDGHDVYPLTPALRYRICSHLYPRTQGTQLTLNEFGTFQKENSRFLPTFELDRILYGLLLPSYIQEFGLDRENAQFCRLH